MNTHERFQAVMRFEPYDRLPIVEWANWWDKTIARWHDEQLPETLTDRYDICRHLGMDVYVQDWFRPRSKDCPRPPHRGAPIVANEADYDRIRKHLFPWPVVNRRQWEQFAEEQRNGDVALWFTVEGFFWFPRTLFGIEPHMTAFYEQPELMHRMNADLTEWTLRVVEEVCSICTPDFMTFAEDMSYNHGPMLSRALFDEFMKPCYDQIVPLLKDKGVLTIVDSDGDITQAAPWFTDAGLEGILPLERQAGVDVAEARRRHPDMCFIGCFDKMTMTRGEDAMRAEFERLLPTAVEGGLIISCDHQTPPGVSFDEYQTYLRLFREYAGRAGALSREGRSRVSPERPGD